ncbi:MAG: hypothetical protein ACQEXK_26945 [Bacillota bacterium]
MTKINGVDTKVIENVVENYKKNPEEGIAGWSSSVEWIGGFYAEAQVGDHKPPFSLKSQIGSQDLIRVQTQ